MTYRFPGPTWMGWCIAIGIVAIVAAAALKGLGVWG